MKKTIALISFIILSTRQYAQIEKGTYVPSIAINATYSANPSKDTLSSSKINTWGATTSLGFGRFIQDNLLLTGSFVYGHSNSKYDKIASKHPSENDGNSSFGNNESIAASLLKFKFLTENFAIRYGASLSVSYSETINNGYSYLQGVYDPVSGTYGDPILQRYSSYTNTLGITLNLLAGVQYFVSKNLALTGNMGFFSTNYNYSPYQKVKQTEAHSLTFSLTPSFNAFTVGLSYYIRPKNQAAK